MCLLAVYFRVLPGAPVLLAANREEWRSRPTAPPERRPGSPQVICGLDLVAGGTWLGVNQHGVIVAITNRPLPKPAGTPPSRGILCRRLLSLPTATAAAQECARQFAADSYAGANFVCLDRVSGYVVSNPGEVVTRTLSPGLHVLTNGDLDNEADARIALVSPVARDQIVLVRGGVSRTGPASLPPRARSANRHEHRPAQPELRYRFVDDSRFDRRPAPDRLSLRAGVAR